MERNKASDAFAIHSIPSSPRALQSHLQGGRPENSAASEADPQLEERGGLVRGLHAAQYPSRPWALTAHAGTLLNPIPYN